MDVFTDFKHPPSPFIHVLVLKIPWILEVMGQIYYQFIGLNGHPMI